jgi:hypothetical protein
VGVRGDCHSLVTQLVTPSCGREDTPSFPQLLPDVLELRLSLGLAEPRELRSPDRIDASAVIDMMPVDWFLGMF